MSRVIDLDNLDYTPPAGLSHCHAQSVLAGSALRGYVVRRRAAALRAAAQATVLECRDGVRLLGHVSRQPGASRGCVVVLHGWEGCADSNYVLSAGAALYAAGYDVFRLNFRDHGATHELNEGLFHSCRIDEVVDAVRVISRRHAHGPVRLLGFSLGGNFALRVAMRAPEVLTSVITVCPVLSPRRTMHALDNGLWVYRWHFLKRWRRSLLAKAAAFPDRYDFGDLRRFRTLTETTEHVVRRYTAFPNLDAYLDGYAIVGGALSGLETPSLIITAADDPLIPSDDLADLARGDALAIELLDRGGHCAFLESYGLHSWIDRAVVARFGGHAHAAAPGGL